MQVPNRAWGRGPTMPATSSPSPAVGVAFAAVMDACRSPAALLFPASSPEAAAGCAQVAGRSPSAACTHQLPASNPSHILVASVIQTVTSTNQATVTRTRDQSPSHWQRTNLCARVLPNSLWSVRSCSLRLKDLQSSDTRLKIRHRCC